MKQHTVSGISVVPTASWATVTAAAGNVPQGDGSNHRDGDVIETIGIRLRGFFEGEISELIDTSVYIRIVAYIDSLAGGVQATLPEPFGTNSLVAMRTYDNKGLKILMDETFLVGSSEASTGNMGPGGFHFDRYIKLRKKMKFEDNTTGEALNGVLRVILISNQSFATSATLDMETQLYFRDA